MENSGLLQMLTHEKIDDLSRMYSLFSRVSNGHHEMKSTMSEYIKLLVKNINVSFGGLSPVECLPTVTGSGLSGLSHPSLDSLSGTESSPSNPLPPLSSSNNNNNNNNNCVPPANPFKWVESILDIKDKFDKILDSSFNKDKSFINEVNSALGHVINLNRKSPEFLSLFIDENLKKGFKGVSFHLNFLISNM